jgi:anhydro-N-acetylmuramic acid kinase
MKQHSGNKIKAIGMMSGTSLDGMDLAAVEFRFENGCWQFSVAFAETVTYPDIWLEKLKTAPSLSGEKLMELHSNYGHYIGNEINRFIRKTGFIPDVVASHGHTVFHQPENHFTFQVGSGAEIAAITQTTTVADFRSGDVALGGQGAPLVPAGDRLLFADYDYCLNLGGFANISFEANHQRMAFDICPVNIVLNYFAEKQGFPFDKNGELGKNGHINIQLLHQLNNLEFYRIKPPKSLGREWVESCFLPVIKKHNTTEKDIFRTLYEHMAQQIGNTTSGNGKMLVTGGGAFNTFLMERITEFTQAQLVIPPCEIINFKEAIIFAFLGVLRVRNENNCFASVTGAKNDHSAGIIFTASC